MKYIFTAFCCIALFGCAMDPLGRNAIRNTPITFTNNTKKISVMKFVDTIEVGKQIGKGYNGLACVKGGKMRWNGSEKMINHMSDIVRVKLEKQGYTLVDKAYSPFNEEYGKKAELLLGGKLVDVEINNCASVKGDKGEMYLKVQWEIYDSKLGNVVLTVSTEGTSIINEFDNLGQKRLFEESLDMSIDNLLADNTFISLLTEK